jgi:hypothetical protein
VAIQDFLFHIVKDPTTITASTIGLALAPTLDGEALSSQDDDSGPWLEHRTQNQVDKSAGLLTAFAVASAGWQPKVEIRFWTPSDKADLLLWAGLFSGKPDGVATPSNLNMAAFRFQSSAPNSPWEVVVSNGGANLLTDTFGNNSFAGNTKYTLGIEVQATQVRFSINAQLVRTIPLVPTGTVPLGIALRVTRLAGGTSAKRLRWQRVSWVYPG